MFWYEKNLVAMQTSAGADCAAYQILVYMITKKFQGIYNLVLLSLEKEQLLWYYNYG